MSNQLFSSTPCWLLRCAWLRRAASTSRREITDTADVLRAHLDNRPARGGLAIQRLVPWFILAFVGAVAVRASGLLPQGVLSVADVLTTLLLAAGMYGLGMGIRARDLWPLPIQVLTLATISTIIAADTDQSVFGFRGASPRFANGLAEPGSPFDILLAGIRPGVTDVVGHRAMEQGWILGHQGKTPAQGIERQIGSVDAIEQNSALCRLIEVQQQIEQRGFSGAVFAHQRVHRPRAHA